MGYSRPTIRISWGNFYTCLNSISIWYAISFTHSNIIHSILIN
nr:MAG TPA: hypothetical protein [Bacteriophage sp.]